MTPYLSQRHLLSSIPSAYGNLGQPITLEPIRACSPLRLIRTLSNLPVVLEQQVTNRQFDLMRGEEASRTSVTAISKGREVYCCCDELSSLQDVPGQSIGLAESSRSREAKGMHSPSHRRLLAAVGETGTHHTHQVSHTV